MLYFCVFPLSVLVGLSHRSLYSCLGLGYIASLLILRLTESSTIMNHMNPVKIGIMLSLYTIANISCVGKHSSVWLQLLNLQTQFVYEVTL